MAGPTPQGFQIKTYEQLLAEIVADQQAAPAIGPNAILDEFEWIGQNNGIMANKLAEIWELLRPVYNSGDPRVQEGYILAALAAFSGTIKERATYTLAAATVNLDAGFTLVAGSTCSVAGEPTRKFALVSSVTNSGGAPADVPALFKAIDAGPVEALATTLNVISPTVAGWNTVTNASDAITGKPEETDPALRVRRIIDLAAEGSATVNGIIGDIDIAQIPGVISFSLLENTTDSTQVIEGVSLAPHAVQLFVWDGPGLDANDQAIANALFETIGCGITSLGSVVSQVVDEQGDSHTVKFSRLAAVDAWIRITVTYDAKVFDVSNGPTEIRDALLTKGAVRQTRGRDVLADQYEAAALTVAGTEEVTVYRQGATDPGAGGGNIETTISVNGVQIALLDSARIVVTVIEAAAL